MKDHCKDRKDGQNRNTRYLSRSRRGNTDEKERPQAGRTHCPCFIIFPGGCLVIRSQNCAQCICDQTMMSSQGWKTGFSHRVPAHELLRCHRCHRGMRVQGQCLLTSNDVRTSQSLYCAYVNFIPSRGHRRWRLQLFPPGNRPSLLQDIHIQQSRE